MNDINEKELLDRINNIKYNVILQNKFFGYLLIYLNVVLSDKIKTCATDGEYIYFNKNYANNLNDYEIMFLLLHELHHIILGHLYRSNVCEDNKIFSKACDYVVNSYIFESFDIKNKIINIKNIDNVLPNGNKCIDYTAEQVYQFIKENENDDKLDLKGNEEDDIDGENFENIDEHSMWKKNSKNTFNKDMWKNRISNVMSDKSKFGNIPANLRKELENFSKPKIDWRVVLKNFIEEEITDYSFNPPDKRMSDFDIIMPDYNEVEEKISNVFFFVDTSGSMTNEEITEYVSEIKGCLQQYNGKIDAYIGYFDYNVSSFKNFQNEEEMIKQEVYGGGGTSFENIFEYLKEHKDEFERNKKKVIIMTDGYADFPDEKIVSDYELLWIINNDNIKPPYGELIVMDRN